MRDRYDPTFPRGAGTLPAAQFIDTSDYGVVPFRVTLPILRQAQSLPRTRSGDEGSAKDVATSRPHGEPVEPRGPTQEPPTIAALRATIDAITHDARWRGPPRDLPLAERVAGRRTVAALNAAIAGLAVHLAENPPAESRAIHLVTVPTTVLVTLADLKPALAMAARALRWLEERRHWLELRASWDRR